MSIATLRRFRDKLGTKRAAELLGIPAPSLRRILSTGRISANVAARYRALPKAPSVRAKKPSPPKRSWHKHETGLPAKPKPKVKAPRPPRPPPPPKLPADILKEEQEKLAEIWRAQTLNAEKWQQARNTWRFLKENNLPIPAIVKNIHRKTVHEKKRLEQEEQKLQPAETLEERVARIKNPEREAYSIAKKYRVSARGIFILFYSPPQLGTVTR